MTNDKHRQSQLDQLQKLKHDMDLLEDRKKEIAQLMFDREVEIEIIEHVAYEKVSVFPTSYERDYRDEIKEKKEKKLQRRWLIMLFLLIPTIGCLATLIQGFIHKAGYESFVYYLPVVLAVIFMFVLFIVVSMRIKEKSAILTEEEKKILEEKRTIDLQNERIYQQQCAQAKQLLREENACHLQVWDDKITLCNQEIAALEKAIQDNHILVPEDVPRLDRICNLMQSGRADTVKEALKLVDEEEYRAKKEKEEAERWDEIMEEISFLQYQQSQAIENQLEYQRKMESQKQSDEVNRRMERYQEDMRRQESEEHLKQELLNLEIELNRR